MYINKLKSYINKSSIVKAMLYEGGRESAKAIADWLGGGQYSLRTDTIEIDRGNFILIVYPDNYIIKKDEFKLFVIHRNEFETTYTEERQ